MMDWLHQQWEWLSHREDLFVWIGGISLATIIVSAFAVPMLIRRLPHDYFLENSEAAEWMRHRHPMLRISFLILKNLLGGVLVLGGLIMFLTPGQGILTLVVGILLLNFPGKRRFEVWLIRRKPLHRAVDWIRRRAEKRPLELPEE